MSKPAVAIELVIVAIGIALVAGPLASRDELGLFAAIVIGSLVLTAVFVVFVVDVAIRARRAARDLRSPPPE